MNDNYYPQRQNGAENDTAATQEIPLFTDSDDMPLGRSSEDKPVYKNNKKTAEKKKKSKKNSGAKGCLTAGIWIFCIVAVSVGLAVGALFAVTDFLGVGRSGTVEIEIPKGATSAKIAKILDENGVIKYSTLFRAYTKLAGYDGRFKYGVYVINKENGYEAIADKLLTEGAVADAVKVMIPESANIDAIRERFVQAGICTKEEFNEAIRDLSYYKEFDFINEIPEKQVYYKLEGYIFPDTYTFYNYGGVECARQAIKTCLKNLQKKIEPYKTEIENSEFSFHEIMTMASIIEMESGSCELTERQNVSAVFFNRLAWKDEPNLLGSSPTAKYPYGNGRYDTNKTKGLPPGPLCSPSALSIAAALSPTADFDYYYFVTDKNGAFYYNKTYAEHKATIKDLQRKKLWAE